MSVSIVTPPTREPILLDEAKQHLRVDTTDDDMLIAGLITAAREACETLTGRALITQTIDFRVDPGDERTRELYYPWRDAYTPGFYRLPVHSALELPRPPLQAVVEVAVRDEFGAETVTALPSADYIVDTQSTPGRLINISSAGWPWVSRWSAAAGFRVRYTAGYTDPSRVPMSLKAWMLLQVGALYENREQVSVGSSRGVIVDVGSWSDRFLKKWRVGGVV